MSLEDLPSDSDASLPVESALEALPAHSDISEDEGERPQQPAASSTDSASRVLAPVLEVLGGLDAASKRKLRRAVDQVERQLGVHQEARAALGAAWDET
eukprot:8397361-Alexandrium_andersonii.AAC.1